MNLFLQYTVTPYVSTSVFFFFVFFFYNPREPKKNFFFSFLFFKIQYNKYNTIIQHISAPVPTVDNTRIQIYMLMLYIHNRQKRYIHTDIHTDKELDKVLHRQIFALHKA